MATQSSNRDELIHLRFVGNEIRPDKISSAELAELIKAYEATIASTIKKQHPEQNESDLIVSLVEIKETSLALGFFPKLRQFALGAATTITTSINTGDFTQLPIKSIESLRYISSFCKHNQCVAEFRINGVDSSPIAIITGETSIEIPNDFFIEGETTLYGRLERVGGVEPKVRIRIDEGKLLYIDLSADDAKQLANNLYEEVAIRGLAKWRKDDAELESFEFESIIPFNNIPIDQSFVELRKLIGRQWDKISDHQNYINDLRYS